MKKDFDETTFYADSTFHPGDRQRPDFAPTEFGQVAQKRKSRRRGQQLLGVLMLLAGYMSLAVTADTDTGWLLVRVVGGFGLLFAGFAVAIGPLLASIFGGHD
jgi:uncharacterized membrane protein (DUF485 family)